MVRERLFISSNPAIGAARVYKFPYAEQTSGLAVRNPARQVRSVDDLFVPSQIARGWAEIGTEPKCSVRITAAGRHALIDVGDRAAGEACRRRM